MRSTVVAYATFRTRFGTREKEPTDTVDHAERSRLGSPYSFIESVGQLRSRAGHGDLILPGLGRCRVQRVGRGRSAGGRARPRHRCVVVTRRSATAPPGASAPLSTPGVVSASEDPAAGRARPPRLRGGQLRPNDRGTRHEPVRSQSRRSRRPAWRADHRVRRSGGPGTEARPHARQAGAGPARSLQRAADAAGRGGVQGRRRHRLPQLRRWPGAAGDPRDLRRAAQRAGRAAGGRRQRQPGDHARHPGVLAAQGHRRLGRALGEGADHVPLPGARLRPALRPVRAVRDHHGSRRAGSRRSRPRRDPGARGQGPERAAASGSSRPTPTPPGRSTPRT